MASCACECEEKGCSECCYCGRVFGGVAPTQEIPIKLDDEPRATKTESITIMVQDCIYSDRVYVLIPPRYWGESKLSVGIRAAIDQAFGAKKRGLPNDMVLIPMQFTAVPVLEDKDIPDLKTEVDPATAALKEIEALKEELKGAYETIAELNESLDRED